MTVLSILCASSPSGKAAAQAGLQQAFTSVGDVLQSDLGWVVSVGEALTPPTPRCVARSDGGRLLLCTRLTMGIQRCPWCTCMVRGGGGRLRVAVAWESVGVAPFGRLPGFGMPL